MLKLQSLVSQTVFGVQMHPSSLLISQRWTMPLVLPMQM